MSVRRLPLEYLIVLYLMSFLATCPSRAQDTLPNPGFEQWSAGAPSGWTTDNIPGGVTPVTQSFIRHSGISAVLGECVPFARNVRPPQISAGVHVASNDAAVTGWYRFLPLQGDMFRVSVSMFSGTFLVGTGSFASAAVESTYLQFSVPITYVPGPGPADSCFVMAQIDGPVLNSQVHNGSQVWLDDFAFESPLPIQLSGFSVTLVGGAVQVNWKTASEVNVYGFKVQRSLQVSSGFEDISPLIPGHGSSSTGFAYSFTDGTAPSGRAYYRLEQMDLDGSVHDSDPLTFGSLSGVSEAGIAGDGFLLRQNYPNPFNPTTAISYQLAADSRVSLEVFDVLGRKIASLAEGTQGSGLHTVQFDAGGISSGVYLYRLTARPLSGSREYSSTKRLTVVR